MTQVAEHPAEPLRRAWAHSDRIFALVAPDALLARPIALRHPFVFYVGHLPAFAWNHIGAGVLGRPPFHPEFDELFSRGIDPDVEDPTRVHDHPAAPAEWPALEAVLAYRDAVRAAVLAALHAVADRAAVDPMARGGRVVRMVVEHELMHQETLLYMIHQLAGPLKVRPPELPVPITGAPARPEAIAVPAGRVTLGADFEALAVGWDNEFPATPVDVPAFVIDSLPVTNAEFLAFVEEGGYRRSELWRPEDWSWRAAAGVEHPAFWVREADGWRVATLFDALPWADAAGWPASVSLAEARAYARWRGARLPTEAELDRAAHATPDGGERALPWGDGLDGGTRGNFGFRQWAPTPVGRHPGGASAWGVHELVGNGWEWTETPFDGFPGFKAYIERYPGYSADFFDGKHFVLKGASWATADGLVRRSFRNWFQAHYPYVFTKFRCVR